MTYKKLIEDLEKEIKKLEGKEKTLVFIQYDIDGKLMDMENWHFILDGEYYCNFMELIKTKLSALKQSRQITLKEVDGLIDDFFDEEKYTTEQDLDGEDFIRIYWKDIDKFKQKIREELR